MENDNSTKVLTQFMAALGVPVTRQSISDELEKHPDYYSFLAFSDVLANFNIPNSAYQIPHEELDNVPTPFITFLTDKTFALVTQMDDKQVTLSNDRWHNKKFTKNDFLRKYGRSVLVAEPTAASGEPGYAKKRKTEIAQSLRIPLALTVLALIVSAALILHPAYLTSIGLQIALLFLFKTVGLTATILLLIQSIDANNPLIQKLCGQDNDKNCNAILSSKAAKIWGVSWSEIGFFYFAGTWLAILFKGDAGTIQLLSCINLIALPYTIYSVYYQWRIAQQWCIFCCVVQGVLWLEFFTFLPSLLRGSSTPALVDVVDLAIAMILPIALWLLIKPYLLQISKVNPLTQQLRKFKYNKDLFDAILKEQPRYAIPAYEWSITLGNVEANNVVTMVSNPYCQPCAKAHLQIEAALNSLDNIQVRIVFVGKNTDVSDANTRVHRHLMALNAQPDKRIVQSALHDWYAQKQKNYEEWVKAYPVSLNSDNNSKLDKQKAWIDVAEIKATPTLLINGYRLPAVYQLHDLKYMLE